MSEGLACFLATSSSGVLNSFVVQSSNIDFSGRLTFLFAVAQEQLT